MVENSKIEEIRNKADIVSVVSDYLSLRKRGKNYLALCPFHNEKTPSFTVSPDKQLYHCFGCSEGGNSISFIMKIENVSFLEAVKILADKFNIPFDFQPSVNTHPEQASLHTILTEAMNFYESEIRQSKAAIDYCLKRGFDKKSVGTFRIGYSPDSWDKTYRHLMSKGFSPVDIDKAGLLVQKEGSTSYYDRFRNRIMFPIFDIKGKIVGFGGRSIDGTEPKYLNSPDSPIYNKGNILYALNQTRDHIKAKDSVLIMEGYVDTITAFCFGFENVVASLGTSLTAGHIKNLSRLTNNFYLVFDSDAAGEKASDRSIEMLRDQGMYPKVVVMTGGKDPDEIIRKDGKEKFAEMIAAAKPWLQYKIDKVIEGNNISTPEGKSKVVKEVAQILAKEKDTIVKNEYIKKISTLLAVDIETVNVEVNRIARYSEKYTSNYEAFKRPIPKLIKAFNCIIRAIADDGSSNKMIFSQLEPEDISDKNRRDIFEKVLSAYKTGTMINSSLLIDALEDDQNKKVLTEIMFDENSLLETEDALKDCIKVIKDSHTRTMIGSIQDAISSAEKAKDFEKVETLQNELKRHHSELTVI